MNQAEKNIENSIGKRIEALAIHMDGSVNKFATGRLKRKSNSTIATAIATDRPSWKTLRLIIDKTPVSCEWLLRAEGEMMRSMAQKAEGQKVIKGEAESKKLRSSVEALRKALVRMETELGDARKEFEKVLQLTQ